MSNDPFKKKIQRRFKFLVTHKGLHSIYTQYPIHYDIEQNIKNLRSKIIQV